MSESYGEVKPRGVLSLPLRERLKFDATAVAIKTQNAFLSFKALCKGSALTWSLEQSASPWRKLNIFQKNSLRLQIANLSQQSNQLEITFAGFWGNLGSQTVVALPGDFRSLDISLQVPPGASVAYVHAQGRWTGKAFADDSELRLVEEPSLAAPVAAGTRYFLFASRDPSTLDSFVVPMVSPKLIQESLDQIAKPEAARLLVARIEKSLAGLNRDFSSAVKVPWSWQVAEAQNYADFAHIACDGTPQIVEDRLNSWLTDNGSTICFWNYRVIREVSPSELMQAPLWSLPALGSLPHTH